MSSFIFPKIQHREAQNDCVAIALQNIFPALDLVGAAARAGIKNGLAFWEIGGVLGLYFSAVVDGVPMSAKEALQLMHHCKFGATRLFGLRRVGPDGDAHFSAVLLRKNEALQIDALQERAALFDTSSEAQYTGLYILMCPRRRAPLAIKDSEILHLLSE
jgi:hypothetical protein